MRKYIQYARAQVHPVMHSSSLDKEKISSLYVALPRESRSSGGVPVAVRHLESLLRMAEAHARMHLRDLVRSDDVEAAIRQTLHSFVVAQKFAVRRALQRSFAKYLHSNQDKEHLLLHLLQELFRNEQMYQVIRLRQKGRGSRWDSWRDWRSLWRNCNAVPESGVSMIVPALCKGRSFRALGMRWMHRGV